MSITPLQEPNDSQFGLLFGKELKQRMKARGWAAKPAPSKIAIFEHGQGYYLLNVSGQQAKELEALIAKKVMAGSSEKVEKVKGGKDD